MAIRTKMMKTYKKVDQGIVTKYVVQDFRPSFYISCLRISPFCMLVSVLFSYYELKKNLGFPASTLFIL